MITCPSTSFWRQFRVVDGLKALAERARRELLAAGETVRKRTPGPMAPAQGAVAKTPGLRSFGHETILVASELAASAVAHSSSRQPRGRFIVRAEVCPVDCVRVEVQDQGEPVGPAIVPGVAGPTGSTSSRPSL